MADIAADLLKTVGQMVFDQIVGDIRKDFESKGLIEKAVSDVMLPPSLASEGTLNYCGYIGRKDTCIAAVSCKGYRFGRQQCSAELKHRQRSSSNQELAGAALHCISYQRSEVSH